MQPYQFSLSDKVTCPDIGLAALLDNNIFPKNKNKNLRLWTHIFIPQDISTSNLCLVNLHEVILIVEIQWLRIFRPSMLFLPEMLDQFG